MKKKIIGIVLAVVIVIAGIFLYKTNNKQTDEQAKTKGTIVIGTEAFAKPFVYKENNKLKGFDIEVARAIAKEAGYKAKFVTYNWSGIFGALDSDKIDTIAHEITITPERSQKYKFSNPYLYSSEAFVVQKGASIDSLSDLKGKTVLVSAGTDGQVTANNLKDKYGFTVKSIANNPAGELLEVADKRVDALLTDKVQAELRIKEQGLSNKVEYGFSYEGNQQAFPFAKNSKKYKDWNAAEKRLLKDGTIKKLSEKWLNQDVTVKLK
ncbi:transporter substrate-binding domain-containing protein [Liquorilactobacillus uvarum]|uniref:transporter substrate-binding domain-containing protein n=3 Tax=Bacillati TaxID=1783272 RepID=UPI00288B8B91|nr:transporter substrate-binding domain-containing protein [Liquorilactobacillus uvarum]